MRTFKCLNDVFVFRPLVYTISVLLPAAYLIGLIFTLKTHSHIYDIHISDAHGHGAYLCFWVMPFWLNDVLFSVLIVLCVSC